jgi:hypothetical protein
MYPNGHGVEHSHDAGQGEGSLMNRKFLFIFTLVEKQKASDTSLESRLNPSPEFYRFRFKFIMGKNFGHHAIALKTCSRSLCRGSTEFSQDEFASGCRILERLQLTHR